MVVVIVGFCQSDESLGIESILDVWAIDSDQHDGASTLKRDLGRGAKRNVGQGSRLRRRPDIGAALFSAPHSACHTRQACETAGWPPLISVEFVFQSQVSRQFESPVFQSADTRPA